MADQAGAPPLSDLDARLIALQAYNLHRASQRPEELAEMIRRVADLEPQVTVEIGCDVGGTLFVWAQLCDRVYGITLPENTWASGGQGEGYQLKTHGADVILGDSHDPAVLDELVRRLDGTPVDVLHIDGDHSYEGVRNDFDMYAPLVRSGGLVLFHDVENHADRRNEVPRFWAELTADRSCEVIARPQRPLGFGIWPVP